MNLLKQKNELVKAALASHGTPYLRNEIDHFLSIDHDEEREEDYYDALQQAEDLAEYNDERGLLKSIRLVGIALGCIRHYTDEELRGLYVSHGKKYDFILNKKKYRWERHLDEVITEGKQR